jgi:hypothetical protein
MHLMPLGECTDGLVAEHAGGAEDEDPHTGKYS